MDSYTVFWTLAFIVGMVLSSNNFSRAIILDPSAKKSVTTPLWLLNAFFSFCLVVLYKVEVTYILQAFDIESFNSLLDFESYDAEKFTHAFGALSLMVHPLFLPIYFLSAKYSFRNAKRRKEAYKEACRQD